MKFPVVLHKDPDSDYGVTVPDLPGCFSASETISEALENIQEAMALHYQGLVADDEPLPVARDLDSYVNDPDYQGGIWVIVDFDDSPYQGKAVRFNATLPSGLLHRIDKLVKTDGRYASRSGFLAKAALHELELAR